MGVWITQLGQVHFQKVPAMGSFPGGKESTVTTGCLSEMLCSGLGGHRAEAE